MNYISMIAVIFSTGILFLGLRMATDNMYVFLDFPSIVIVFGGTLAATAVAFRLDRLSSIFFLFVKKMTKDNDKTEYQKIIMDLMKLSEANRASDPSINGMVEKLKDPFLKDAMITLMDQVLSKENLIKVLKSRAHNQYQHYMQDANKFKVIGKFPPALGMMGTTIGMIVLLSKIASSDAAKYIGPAMSLCLITTLYGVALSNLIIIPMAENMVTAAKEQYFKNTIIVEGVKLIYEKTNPVELAEMLNAFLRQHDRVDWKKVLKKGIA